MSTDAGFLATLASALRDLARTGELQGTAAVLELERLALSCDQERTGTGPPVALVSGPGVGTADLCWCGHAFTLHRWDGCLAYAEGGSQLCVCTCGVPPIGRRAERARGLGLLP